MTCSLETQALLGVLRVALSPNSDADDFDVAQKTLDRLERYVGSLEFLCEERDHLLAAIPECPLHGLCVPHAVQWIEQAKQGVST